MNFREIDSMEELQKEKDRLRQEAKIAGILLHQTTQNVYNNGKQFLKPKISIPLALGALAAFGAKQLNAYHAATSNEEEVLTAGIQQGIGLFREPSNHKKWLAFLPVLHQLWKNWQLKNAIENSSIPDSKPL